MQEIDRANSRHQRRRIASEMHGDARSFCDVEAARASQGRANSPAARTATGRIGQHPRCTHAALPRRTQYRHPAKTARRNAKRQTRQAFTSFAQHTVSERQNRPPNRTTLANRNASDHHATNNPWPVLKRLVATGKIGKVAIYLRKQSRGIRACETGIPVCIWAMDRIAVALVTIVSRHSGCGLSAFCAPLRPWSLYGQPPPGGKSLRWLRSGRSLEKRTYTGFRLPKTTGRCMPLRSKRMARNTQLPSIR